MINIKKQVDVGHYRSEGFSSLRIDSFAQQIKEISFSECKSILEVGVGGGLISHFLKLFEELQYTGIDIDSDLQPDVIGSVTKMPFLNKQFELTLCCQVLEHLPFYEFEKALKELNRVTSKTVILSLPDQRKRMGLSICVPKLQWKKFELNYRILGSKYKDKWHQWEIGYKNVPFSLIKYKILESGLKIKTAIG
jgi:SAM-dependent methyltransferase